MAIGLAIMAGIEVGKAIGDLITGHNEEERKNKILGQAQKDMSVVEGQMDETLQKQTEITKRNAIRQQHSADTFTEREKDISGLTIDDYKNYLHENGQMSTDDYISKMRDIQQKQIDQDEKYKIESAKTQFDYETKRQQMENYKEQTRIKGIINSRGLKGSSIAEQTIAGAVSDEVGKMNNLARTFNTTYQNAVYAKSQSEEKMTETLNTELQDMSTKEFQGFLGWQSSQAQSAFQDMQLDVQQKTSQFEMEMADLKFEELIQENKLQDIRTKATLAVGG